ncbi:integration host factor subunit beta [Candidatus Kinetoplastibacterium blastocrithidii TCC012E]|uniref:Integration host factor subunit beta n=2 Tax=Candidatus Kinetoplastidibacterium blastocrithidiae TaxID=233181 RepID=M1M0P9_9PROT|nr:integration host factor subunit beta [Candidatus Kinetoplastibacterium blastocrithidii (ex Strigomonas culicis)]AGF49851.1 integration host factor subunit beta [Candidatus Kinetoplastibacterium blastocrithidii TCC012E]
MADYLKKNDLLRVLSSRLDYLSIGDLERAIKAMLEIFEDCFSSEKRIEIRGFGSFFISKRGSRVARNPKSGKNVFVADRLVLCFRPGKALKEKLIISKK